MPNKVAQFVQLLRSTARERRLGTVIFFVTSRCNAKCETCFYHEELNRPGDMTFEQVEREVAVVQACQLLGPEFACDVRACRPQLPRRLSFHLAPPCSCAAKDSAIRPAIRHPLSDSTVGSRALRD